MNVVDPDAMTWDGLLTGLRDQGIGYIRLHFYGGGDSGGIESITFLPESFVDDRIDETGNGEIDFSEAYFEDRKNDWERLSVFRQSEEIIQFVRHNAAEPCQNVGDWWNGDGGTGYMFLRTKDGSYHINVGFHYTDTNYEDHIGKVGGDE